MHTNQNAAPSGSMLRPGVRLYAAAATLFLAFVAFALPPVVAFAQSDRVRLNRKGSLVQEQYRLPMAADRDTLLTAVELLKAAGQRSDAALLRRFVERRAVKALLGESFPVTGTVETAIANEKRAEVGAQHMGALRTRVRLMFGPRRTESRGDEIVQEYPAAARSRVRYLGDSIWQSEDGAKQVTLYYRVHVESYSREPISAFDSLVELKIGGATFGLLCLSAPGQTPLAPGARAVLVCSWSGPASEAARIIDALRGPSGEWWMRIPSVEFAQSGIRVTDRRDEFPERGELRRDRARAHSGKQLLRARDLLSQGQSRA